MAGLDESSSLSLVPYVAWGGAIITVLLTALAWTQTRARERAEESEAVAAAVSRSLQAQTATLEVVNRTGAQLAGELDLERLLQAVTDAATRLTGAQFGAFLSDTRQTEGGPYNVSAVSGLPREFFGGFPEPRSTALFEPTFRGEGIVRSADITTDPRYAPDLPSTGMPGRLQVRSFLAVPVRSRSGRVLGSLFFAHAAPSVFTEQAEAIVGGIAAQAAIAIDNARLYGQVQRLLASERVARAEAERVSRLKDEFLATLSHELRTPLNAVIGWAHMLSAGRLSHAKQGIAAGAILRNARAQAHLVEDLLDMSRIISGRLHMETADVDVRDVVRDALDVVRPTAEAKHIDMLLHVDDAAHLVRGDADRLQQVVWNLLSNAVKFTPAGGRVDVRVRTFGERVEISVSDTGIGIEPEFLPFVFERFRQADGSFTRGHGGLGLGLSIVRHLVELHGGTVEARSEGPGLGSTFLVRVPVAPVRADQPAALDAEVS
jgi:signal transduction histidine kinase